MELDGPGRSRSQPIVIQSEGEMSDDYDPDEWQFNLPSNDESPPPTPVLGTGDLLPRLPGKVDETSSSRDIQMAGLHPSPTHVPIAPLDMELLSGPEHPGTPMKRKYLCPGLWTVE